MISKERLEELIEQGATIYSTDTKMYGLVKWLELENKLERLEFNKDGEVKLFIIDNGWWHWFNLKDLYEDLEDVKWHKEFGHIERTERLELPTWEELFKEDRVLDCYTQEFGIVKNRSFIGVVLLGVDFTNEIVEVSIGSDQIFCELLTKENYTIACKRARDLFLGEKK